MKIRTHLFILVLALALPLIGIVAYHIERIAAEEARDAEAILSVQAEVLATNIGTKLHNIRHRLEYLATLPSASLLDPAHCHPALTPLLAMHPEYANIVTTDLGGNSICSTVTLPTERSVILGGTPWLQCLLETQRFMLGTPFVGPIIEKQVLVVSQPQREGKRSDGPMIGTVNITLAISAFGPQLPNEHLPLSVRYG